VPRFIAIHSLILLIFICIAPALAAEPGQRLSHKPVRSAATGWAYPLRIYLPFNYAESKQRYPVLYALDGKIRFDLVADRLDELEAEVIVIGIDTTGDVRREIDFVMPGVKAYAEFLTQELVPWIDKQYRTNPRRRALAGHSLAGLASALTMLLENPYDRKFSAFLISDGSFWNQPEQTDALLEELRAKTTALPVKIFMTGATDGNIRGARAFRQRLEDSNFKGLRITYEVYEADHRSVIPLSFRDGLQALYPPTN
jgi:predicted alpha/beta superfamily hydrolase